MPRAPHTSPPEDVFIGADGFAMLALSCAVAVATLGVTLLVAFGYVLRVARRACPDHPGATRVLVLGNRLPPGGAPAAAYRERLDRVRRLSAQGGADIILLGGRTRPDLASEAEAGQDYLVAHGVPRARIFREERSRHTLENLRFYRDAFPATPGTAALLVTNRFHLARALLLARGLGISLIPCAAESRFHWSMALLAKLPFEACLIHWYVVGRAFSFWTKNARMIARIS